MFIHYTVTILFCERVTQTQSHTNILAYKTCPTRQPYIQMYKYIEMVYTFYVLLFTGCHITFQSAVSLALSFQRDELNPLPLSHPG